MTPEEREALRGLYKQFKSVPLDNIKLKARAEAAEARAEALERAIKITRINDDEEPYIVCKVCVSFKGHEDDEPCASCYSDDAGTEMSNFQFDQAQFAKGDAE